MTKQTNTPADAANPIEQFLDDVREQSAHVGDPCVHCTRRITEEIEGEPCQPRLAAIALRHGVTAMAVKHWVTGRSAISARTWKRISGGAAIA
jgi:hypothetical protein